jgi:hypothetical protein
LASDWRGERLGRALCVESMFRRRVRLLVVAAALAFAAVGTGTSVATEPDQRGEGLAQPEHGDPAPLPEPPVLPTEPLATPVDPGVEAPPDSPSDDHALEPEPLDDPYGRDVLREPDAPTPPVEDRSGDEALREPHEALGEPHEALGEPLEALPETVAPPAPDAPAPTTTPPGEPPLTDVEIVPGPAPPVPGDVGEPRRRQGPAPAKRRVEQPSPTLRRYVQTAPAYVQTAPAIVAEAPATTTVAAPARQAPPDAPRFHVVQPGDSLWSIAQSLLGSEASTGAIAGEVARLWLLNESRIGTGDPDLLPVGVRLAVREAA